MKVVGVLLGLVLFCPLIILILLFLVFLKMRMKKRYALGFAADLTTVILFFSVPLALKSVWGDSFASPLLIILLIVGLCIVFMDWRTKKEIEVLILLKKIWRIYFVGLSTLYVMVCITGIVINIVAYIANP